MKWNDAKQYCEDLAEGGFTDWRLPNLDDFNALFGNGQSKFGDTELFWSSYISVHSDSDFALCANFGSRLLNFRNTSDSHYVRCVR